MDESPVDALVIGAGPAGLTAALYLTRFKRRVRVVHDGTARALWVPRTRNVPGFPDGIVGKKLIERMTDHALRYGAEIVFGRVAALKRATGHYRATLEDGAAIAARGVILATGVDTNLARLDEGDHMTAVRDGVLRYCPICDGFEHRDERIAVLGSDLHGAAEAMFLRQFSRHVTLIPKWRVALSDAQREELAQSDVIVLERHVERLVAHSRDIAVQMRGEPVARRFDILYPAFGSRPRNELAAALGLLADDADAGCMPFHAFSDGLLPGLYAAGDVVAGLDQISVAMGQGAMAATRLHNWLREAEGHLMADQD
jgi:thioredoxin reductase (NADPH)